MAEEHRCQAPRLCANNCGFFGSPATQNLCSKCYRDLQLKEQQSSSAKLALDQTLSPPPSSSSSSASVSVPFSSPVVNLPDVEVIEVEKKVRAEASVAAAAEEKPVAGQRNRCMTCRKRVGLTGFKCRCGMTFCGPHRYPEQHGCTFDFKTMDREAIAKANPVIKADKLRKI